MIAHRLGRSVILLERDKHPRFAIGESSTPLSNLLLEDLTTRYDLPRLKPLSKWGSWQRTHPEIACGLKRGFTFYHHTIGEPFAADPVRQDQLLVAASPHDGIADTHWYRAEFDHFLVQEAEKIGVEYLDEVRLDSVSQSDDEVALSGKREGKDILFHARFVVDATGPRGFLHRALRLAELELPNFPSTQALYSHFTGVRRLEEMGIDRSKAAPPYAPPYPVDDAAVHHVFEGGWVWVLRFNNGMTSAGVAATDELAGRLALFEGEPGWERLLKLLPTLQDQFAEASPVRPFTRMPRVAFRSSAISGRRWALLPSAAGFVDPLLSTGFPLTLLGVARLARMIEEDWNSVRFEAGLYAYANQTSNELVAAGRLIASLYASMGDFPSFVTLSLLYFAAASFSETARRLGKPHLAPSFLLHDDPIFGPGMSRCFERAMDGGDPELAQDVLKTIEPFDVAGLGDSNRRNWYPVDHQDLLSARTKVHATREEILAMLDRSGFWAET
jgi:FADH2 O2-dependent halogenase